VDLQTLYARMQAAGSALMQTPASTRHPGGTPSQIEHLYRMVEAMPRFLRLQCLMRKHFAASLRRASETIAP
jgi:hypothetical protein